MGGSRRKKVMFVGIDGLPQEGRIYVSLGVMSASFEYPAGGREAIQNAMEVLNGRSIPKEITLSSRVFTKDNYAQGGEYLQ